MRQTKKKAWNDRNREGLLHARQGYVSYAPSEAVNAHEISVADSPDEARIKELIAGYSKDNDRITNPVSGAPAKPINHVEIKYMEAEKAEECKVQVMLIDYSTVQKDITKEEEVVPETLPAMFEKPVNYLDIEALELKL